MKQPNPPSAIARETIKLLAERKLPPTPDNFRRVYGEVSGSSVETRAWAHAIRDLIREWETYHVGITQARKREMLERVLVNFGHDPDQLHEKLAKLAYSWSESQQESPLLGEEDVPTLEHAGSGGQGLGQSLENLAQALADRWPDLARQSRDLAVTWKSTDASQDKRVAGLDALWREILIRAEDDHELLRAMQRLVRLLFENIAGLVGEDAWVRGQLVAMRALVDGQINYHTLFEAERGLAEIVAKQGKLKDNLLEAKDKLKHLISSFIDRIGEITSNTGVYQERLSAYSKRISEVEDIGQLAEMVDSLTTDMGGIQSVLRASHEELIEARSHVVQAELRIMALEKELDQVSNLVREDQLTGALNRRGLEEAFAREIARAERMHAPLSVALLDIDHFKRLNDSMGHHAGDQALIHLAKVIRDLLRPTDSLSRYGGEEFLILLANTGDEEATQVLRRLQRQLTKEFFLHDQQKVLITFSAGVVQWQPQETREQVVARADAAMYRAKAEGRNRVVRGT